MSEVDMDDKATVSEGEAMLLRVLVLAVPVVTTVALVRAVRADGLGHRPPPRSHHDDVEGVR